MEVGTRQQKAMGSVYSFGGGYCGKCTIAFNFMELYTLLKQQRINHKTHLPRCPYCHYSIRTTPSYRTSQSTKNLFWSWVEQLEKNGEQNVI